MPRPLHLGLLFGAAGAGVPAREPCQFPDAVALIHGGLEVRSGLARREFNSTSPGVYWTVANATVAKLGDEMQKLEKVLEQERQDVLHVKDYIEKVKGEYGKKGTLFSDFWGVMPVGKRDSQDLDVATKLLELFQQEGYTAMACSTVWDLSRALKIYKQASDKHVSELVLTSANAAENEMGTLIGKFFEAQGRTVMTLFERFLDAIRKLMAAMPEDMSYVQLFMKPYLTNVTRRTSKALEEYTKRIVDTNGTEYCDHMREKVIENIIPMVNQTVSVVPELEVFAENQLPEVVPEVQKVLKDFEMITFAVPGLQKETRIWSEKVCGLVSAASVLF